MMTALGLLLLCATCYLRITGADDDPSIDDKIYQILDVGLFPCFRLTNATNQIGCSASSTQTRGVIHVVNKMEDIDWLINHGDNGAYIVAMEDLMFNRSNIMKLMGARVDGIIVKHDTTVFSYPAGGFSPENTCPNSLFGLGSDATCASSPAEDWNPLGNSLTYHDFADFPIFAVSAETYGKIVDCYNEHNYHGNDNKQHYPLCSLEMRADMYVVKDTETCMRRASLPLHQISGRGSICDPLGDNNVWTVPQGIASDLSDKRITLVATKLDSTAFFRDLSFGANNDGAAIAVMLAVMDTIGGLMRNDMVDFDNTNNTLMFMFFQGESWDYIGSSRMVYDIINNKFPHQISMENIDNIIELSHVGMQEYPENDTGTFYIHGNYDQRGSKANDMLEMMKSFASNNDIIIKNSTFSRLPPASAQSFLRYNSSISTIVIGDYDKKFNDIYYGSIYDNIGNLNLNDTNGTNNIIDENSTLVLQLTRLSEIVTMTLLNLTNQNVSMVTTNNSLIAESLYCILFHSNCLLFKGVLDPSNAAKLDSPCGSAFSSSELIGIAIAHQEIVKYDSTLNSKTGRFKAQQIYCNQTISKPQPYNRYVTISRITNSITIQMSYLIPYLLAWNRTVSLQSACPNKDGDVWQVRWVRGDAYNYSCRGDGDCLGVCMNSSKVKYHFAESPAFTLEDYQSVTYSTWAESTWSTVLLRMYLVTSIEQQLGILIGGMMIQIISVYVSIMCWKRGRSLFTIATVQSHDL